MADGFSDINDSLKTEPDWAGRKWVMFDDRIVWAHRGRNDRCQWEWSTQIVTQTDKGADCQTVCVQAR